MSLYEWLLFLHVLSGFALVASLTLYTVLIASMWSKDVPGDVVRVFRLQRVGDVLIGVGSIGVLVFGIWLAIDVGGYALWDGWIIAALVLWFVMGAFGSRTGKIYAAARDRARALARDGDNQPNAELPCARPEPPRAVVPHRLGSDGRRPPHRHDLQAGGLTMLAAIRPDSSNYPLFLHVLGAMLLVGALVTAVTAQLMGWKRSAEDGAATYARLAFRTLLFVGIPAYFAMRIGAEWIYSKEHWADVPDEPAWLGIGYITADLGGILLLVSVVLAGFGARRLARAARAPARSSAWRRWFRWCSSSRTWSPSGPCRRSRTKSRTPAGSASAGGACPRRPGRV